MKKLFRLFTGIIPLISLLLLSGCKAKHKFDIHQTGLLCFYNHSPATNAKPMEQDEYIYLLIDGENVKGYSESKARAGDLKLAWEGILSGTYKNGEIIVIEETTIEGIKQKIQHGYQYADNKLTEYTGNRREDADGIQYLMEGGEFNKPFESIRCQ